MNFLKAHVLIALLLVPHMSAQAWWYPGKWVARTAVGIGLGAAAIVGGVALGAAYAAGYPYYRHRRAGYRHGGGETCSGGGGASFSRSRSTARGGRLEVEHRNGYTTRTRTGPLGFQRKATRYTGIGETPCAHHHNYAYHNNRDRYGKGYDQGGGNVSIRGGRGGSLNVTW